MSPSTDCPFCSIIAGVGAATVVRRWEARRVIAIMPRHPVVPSTPDDTPGHVLVIPFEHVANAGVDPAVSARVMVCAAELAAELPAANIITSLGADATQTVEHLHLHVVRRRAGDNVLLPWTPQHAAAYLAYREALAA